MNLTEENGCENSRLTKLSEIVHDPESTKDKMTEVNPIRRIYKILQ